MRYEQLVPVLKERGIPPGEIFEAALTRGYSEILTEGMNAVDGGAHTGRHTVTLSRAVGPSGSVFAFEPAVSVLRKLVLNLNKEHCENVYIYSMALSNEVKEVEFQFVRDAPAFSGLRERSYPDRARAAPEIKHVLAVRLDGVIPSRHPISFMKLDLEGGEFFALRGARKILAENRPIVGFENGRQRAAEAYGYTAQQFFAFFESLNYRLWTIMGDRFEQSSWATFPFPFYFWAAPAEKSNLADRFADWANGAVEEVLTHRNV